MTRNFNVTICDLCGKERKVESNTYGGRTSSGWYQLSRSVMLNGYTLDFCCLDCVKKYVEKEINKQKDAIH